MGTTPSFSAAQRLCEKKCILSSPAVFSLRRGASRGGQDAEETGFQPSGLLRTGNEASFTVTWVADIYRIGLFRDNF